MIKETVKEVLRPTYNRYHMGQKRHLVLYLSNYIPSAIILTVGMIVEPSWLWPATAIVISLLGIVDYFIFDRWFDKLTRNLLWKRLYSQPPGLDSGLHQAMKDLERNPSDATRKRVNELLRKAE